MSFSIFSNFSKVRYNNYQRRCCQKQLEGLYAPTNRAYRELGHPLVVDATLLIKSTLGYIPQRPVSGISYTYPYYADCI